MADTLANFTSYVRNRGIARTNRYEVDITFPTEVIPADRNLIRLFCTRINLPSVSFDTAEIATFGEQRTIPYRPRYSQATLSFYVDNNFDVKRAFDEWLNLISSPSTRVMSYYADYARKCSINIAVFDVAEDQVRYEVRLEEVYPKSIESIQLDSSSRGPMIFTAVFNYRYCLLDPGKISDFQLLGGDPMSVNTGGTTPLSDITNPFMVT